MIQAKELRIGNLVYATVRPYEESRCIVKIEPSLLMILTGELKNDKFRIDPIELTEEILLKAKYKLVNPNTRCYQKPKSQTLYFSEEGVRMSTGIVMNYLHELQNRVKSIEGKELEIEL